MTVMIINILGYVLPVIYLMLLYVFVDNKNAFLFFNLIFVPFMIAKDAMLGDMLPIWHSLASLFLIYVLSHTATTHRAMNIVSYVLTSFTFFNAIYFYVNSI